MKNRIPDARIKELLRAHRRGEQDCYEQIVRLVSPYVYSFPRIVFGADQERCSEFYEYMLVRLNRILACYQESEVKFVTWFTVVLRNRYMNFLRENRERFDVGMVSLDGDLPLYSILSDKRDMTVREDTGLELLIDRIVSFLNQKQRVFFHLYFIETIRPEDIGFLAITLERTVRQVLKGLEQVRGSMADKYRSREKLSERLGSLYLQIVQSQKEGRTAVSESLRRKRDRALEQYRRIRMNPSYQSIGTFLGMPMGTVSTGIARMKLAAQNALKELTDGSLSIQ
jgi:RNA polymerase sigma factor (sigma-70 family)